MKKSESPNLYYQMYEQRETMFFHQPYSNEQSFYDLVASGNVTRIEENKRKYTGVSNEGKGNLSDDPLKNEIYHMVINTALITRACIAHGLPHEQAYTLSDLYIRSTNNCTTVQAVRDLNDRMVMDFATRMNALHNARNVSAAIYKAINYIYDNLHTKITSAMLAEHVGLNRSYFSVRFKEETGLTVNGYISMARINTAKNMLVSSDYSIVRISNTLCFASQSYFCKKFKEAFGVTPAEFRRMHKT
ncbi:MAG: helix-turn-helix transcriptional regulator [Lachnospiraceae bacterium]